MEKPKLLPESGKGRRVIDLDDYDLTLEIHGHPGRNPPTPHDYKNDNGEYEYIADAYWIGTMKKDNPRDYTEYWQMWNEYANTTVYKRKKAAYERYKERLALLRKKGKSSPADYFKALKEWNEDALRSKNDTYST